MKGTRCPNCGETRWHLTGMALDRATTCHVCGTEVVPERRLPGRARAIRSPGSERRDTDEFPAIPVGGRPPTAAV
jgi:hypothetical protein